MTDETYAENIRDFIKEFVWSFCPKAKIRQQFNYYLDMVEPEGIKEFVKGLHELHNTHEQSETVTKEQLDAFEERLRKFEERLSKVEQQCAQQVHLKIIL